MPSRRQLLYAASAGLVGASAAAATSSGADTDTSAPSPWPMSRHDPAGTAHTTEAGPKDGVSLAWRHERTPWFSGTSEPILCGGTLYVAGEGLLALDPETGDRRFGAPGPYDASPARARASVYNSDTLAVLSGSEITGLNSTGGLRLPVVGAVGTERWTAPTPDHRDPFASMSGERPTPVAAGGTVVTPTPDRASLLALDADDGEVRWQRTPTDDEASVSFTRPAVREGVVYTTAWPYRVAAYDLASGTRQWHCELDEQMLLAPVATEDGLVVLSRESVWSLDPADGSTRWRYGHGGNVTESAPAVADGLVVAPTEDGTLDAVDLATGERAWRVPFSGNGAPVVGDGVVYAVRSYYELVAFDADTGQRRFTYEPEQVPLSAPVVAGGRLYAANRRAILALEEA
ncbi:PQQ-binding-like beta-propeller repeat protein [Haloarcula onubensis]|uniref:PQQ-like beta-propeller repeat protein n=1 Tax=Haloarcula onubensis TaxID=2950539 RepID=A0ABU2FJR5_9EURY|nr:PQQ-binding-like beta-propeller repeat protein [Halomicroarcula sp. S3CR25-11]MDS0280977.1 PQQ-like beta-propeller repeat protein [Halomicroarcula sp. S3CR25-11]